MSEKELCPNQVSDTTVPWYGVPVYCYYEEDITQAAPGTRWFEQASGNFLFRMTKFPIESTEYDDGSGWGRAAIFSQMGANNELLEVLVGNGGQVGLIPREVQLIFQYYQITARRKWLIYATVNLNRLCTTANTPDALASYALQNPPIYACDLADKNYTLQLSYIVRVANV